MAKRLSKAMIAKLPKARHNCCPSEVVSYYEAKDFLGDPLVVIICSNNEKSNMSLRRFNEIFEKI